MFLAQLAGFVPGGGPLARSMQGNDMNAHIQTALGLVGLSLLVLVGPSNSNAKAVANPKLAAIRQAGYPVAFAELNAWYAQPPEADNAASLYQQAFDALAPDDPSSPTVLANNQKALALLHQAATGKPCRYPMDLTQGYKAELPHSPKLKRCATARHPRATTLCTASAAIAPTTVAKPSPPPSRPILVLTSFSP
jgi:hypothetical protein